MIHHAQVRKFGDKLYFLNPNSQGKIDSNSFNFFCICLRMVKAINDWKSKKIGDFSAPYCTSQGCNEFKSSYEFLDAEHLTTYLCLDHPRNP